MRKHACLMTCVRPSPVNRRFTRCLLLLASNVAQCGEAAMSDRANNRVRNCQIDPNLPERRWRGGSKCAILPKKN